MLYGTDSLLPAQIASLNIAELTAAPLAIDSLAGSYESENGGSASNVRIRVQGDTISVTLIEREPGAPADRRSYELRPVSSGAGSADGAVFLRRTAGGVLLLDTARGRRWWFYNVPD